VRRPTRLRCDDGQAVVLVVLSLLSLLAMTGFVIDIGLAYRAQRALQASADAAALAGGQELPDPGRAQAYARQYGTDVGGKNQLADFQTTEMITTKCIQSIPGCSPVNTLVVEETALVPTVFLGILGIRQFSLKAKATACSPCGVKALDVMLVLDRTGSMCQDSNGNSDPSCTDLNNARNGIKTFLQLMDPAKQWVGLAVLPPASSSSNRCGTPATANYNSMSSPYVIVPLSKDYKVNGSLNTSSNFLTTLNCVKGAGNTAYANAIEAAQSELDKSGRPEVQDVIVFMSDGAANVGPTYYSTSSPYRMKPCHQGVTSAGYSKTKGTLMYSIGYALDDDTGGCKAYTGAAEKPTISVYEAMEGIAGSGNFYNRPDPGQLNTIYAAIAADIRQGTAGLIDDDVS
jgi:Putative Flp pilus-assembly TadE/G-like/von Willebrand factor type A domain